MNDSFAHDLTLRERAEAQLRHRQDFAINLAAYVSVNVLLVAIWSAFGGGEFWPLAPILVWGAWLAVHARSVYGPGASVEDPVAREMDRLRNRGTA